jgi:hypothetical protein
VSYLTLRQLSKKCKVTWTEEGKWRVSQGPVLASAATAQSLDQLTCFREPDED